MNKFVLVMAYFDDNDNRMKLIEQYARPKFQQFADMHNLKYIEKNKSNYIPIMLHDDLPFRENFHYNNWLVLDSYINDGTLKDGDIVYRYDSDVYIAKPENFFIPEKSFTYAIDSGNSHCMGFYIIKINDFSKKLIKNIISKERYAKLKNYSFFNEHDNIKRPFTVLADQQSYYTCAGIKPHSWTPFYDLPNHGFHSYPTEHTIFTLDELINNVQILPTEWNVTHLLEETGQYGQRNTYDIVHCTKEKTINRHFAGGQSWNFKEWKEYKP